MLSAWLKTPFKSLKARILLSAIFMVFVLLPMSGLLISNAYEKHMLNGVKNELTAFSFSILAIIEIENENLVMPELLINDRFNVSQSGLYAALTTSTNQQQATVLWQSQSILFNWQAKKFIEPILGKHRFYQVNIDNAPHFVYSISVSYGDEANSTPMTLHIIKQQSESKQLMAEFHKQLIIGLAALMLLLLTFQYLWFNWTLKPLKVLRKELADVEEGKCEHLVQPYPTELIKVTEQLNLLLSAEQKQRQRYRNALSDLAHSLKTPLAVIQSDSTISSVTDEQVSVMNAMIEHQLRKAQSAGQSSWHLGTKIKPIAKKLLVSLQKIYLDKNITFVVEIADELYFKGDEADLLEMLGNLLDNACKATRNKIILKAYSLHNQLVICVSDNGEGLTDSQQKNILQRGTRADTYQKGHGIGLAIVRDLVESYQGQLLITHDDSLKGAKFSLHFTQ